MTSEQSLKRQLTITRSSGKYGSWIWRLRVPDGRKSIIHLILLVEKLEVGNFLVQRFSVDQLWSIVSSQVVAVSHSKDHLVTSLFSVIFGDGFVKSGSLGPAELKVD